MLRPPALPVNVSDVPEALHWLDDATEEEREQWIQSAREGKPPARLLADVFEEDGLSSASDIQRRVRGFTGAEPEVWHILGAIASTDELQRRWAEWSGVSDRDELRLRLEVLSRADHLEDALVPFLMFFFRASVVDLYRAAAKAIGEHLHRSPELLQALRQYASLRGLSLNAPVQLNGRRERRRLLIVLTVAATREGISEAQLQEMGLTDDPLPWEQTEAGARRLSLPPRSSDAAALLAACELTVERVSQPEGIEEIDRLMQETADRCGEDWIDRAVLQRLGRLVRQRAKSDSVDTDRLARISTSIVHHRWTRLTDEDSGRIEGRVSGLLLLDEALRTLAILPEKVRAEVTPGLKQHLPPGAYRWAAHRLEVWMQRENGMSSTGSSAGRISDEDGAQPVRNVDDVLRRVQFRYRAADRTSDFLKEDAQPQAALLSDLLTPLADTSSWQERSTASRALVVFHLLDEAQHLDISEEQERSLSRKLSASDDAAQLLSAILLQLVKIEPPGVEAIVDGAILHRVDDPRVLFALLPAQRRSPLLPILADAVEHFLRWRMAQEASFSATAYLHWLTVRRPHPSFFQDLKAVCANRTYLKADGTAVPLPEIVDWVATGNTPPPEDPTVSLVENVREGLSALLSSQEMLPDVVREVADVLAGEGPQHRKRTIAEVVGDVIPEPGALLVDIRSDASRLYSIADRLLPASPDEIDEAKQAVVQLQQEVDRIQEGLLPALPEREGELTGRVVEFVAREAQAWMAGLDALPASKASLDDALHPLETIQARGLQPHLLKLAWTQLLDTAYADGPRAVERLLRKGLKHPVARGPWSAVARDAWLQSLTATWKEQLSAAMDRQYEAAALRFLTDDAFDPLRTHPSARAQLEDARLWCLDRFLIEGARSAHQAMQPADSDGREISLVQETISIGQRFSKVWLALIVGVILMLDFGDPFVAMAEIGDVQGIILTFGIGVGGAFLYILSDLRRKAARIGPATAESGHPSLIGRAALFFLACLLYTLLITTFMWFLLSGTDEVVHGTGAIGHIVVWSGFALFIGVFFGLIVKQE